MRSRVTNLTELLPGITHEQVCEAITKAFFAHYGERVEAEIISPDKTPDLPNFAETFARQSSWEWNFGQAPAFSHLLDERFSWGGVELHFDVEKAISPAPRCLPTASTPRRWKPSPGDCKAACTARICCNKSAKRCWLTSRTRKRATGVVDVDSGGGKVTR